MMLSALAGSGLWYNNCRRSRFGGVQDSHEANLKENKEDYAIAGVI